MAKQRKPSINQFKKRPGSDIRDRAFQDPSIQERAERSARLVWPIYQNGLENGLSKQEALSKAFSEGLPGIAETPRKQAEAVRLWRELNAWPPQDEAGQTIAPI